MKNKETQCTGCGATVTAKFGMLRDSSGAGYCSKTENGLHSVSLPPVAIKPEAAHTSFEVEISPRIHGGFDLGIALRFVERQEAEAVKGLLTAAPDMLAALKLALAEIKEHNSDYHHHTIGPKVSVIEDAIAKAEAVQA